MLAPTNSPPGDQESANPEHGDESDQREASHPHTGSQAGRDTRENHVAPNRPLRPPRTKGQGQRQSEECSKGDVFGVGERMPVERRRQHEEGEGEEAAASPRQMGPHHPRRCEREEAHEGVGEMPALVNTKGQDASRPFGHELEGSSVVVGVVLLHRRTIGAECKVPPLQAAPVPVLETLVAGDAVVAERHKHDGREGEAYDESGDSETTLAEVWSCHGRHVIGHSYAGQGCAAVRGARRGSES